MTIPDEIHDHIKRKCVEFRDQVLFERPVSYWMELHRLLSRYFAGDLQKLAGRKIEGRLNERDTIHAYRSFRDFPNRNSVFILEYWPENTPSDKYTINIDMSLRVIVITADAEVE